MLLATGWSPLHGYWQITALSFLLFQLQSNEKSAIYGLHCRTWANLHFQQEQEKRLASYRAFPPSPIRVNALNKSEQGYGGQVGFRASTFGFPNIGSSSVRYPALEPVYPDLRLAVDHQQTVPSDSDHRAGHNCAEIEIIAYQDDVIERIERDQAEQSLKDRILERPQDDRDIEYTERRYAIIFQQSRQLGDTLFGTYLAYPNAPPSARNNNQLMIRCVFRGCGALPSFFVCFTKRHSSGFCTSTFSAASCSSDLNDNPPCLGLATAAWAPRSLCSFPRRCSGDHRS